MSKQYLAELREAAAQLQSSGASASVSEDGAGAFVVADLGSRGLELYRGERGSVVIDPAEGDHLLGEVVLESYSEAIATGLRWLRRERAA